MSRELTIMSVAGARPNFMKIAPLAHALMGRPGVRHVLVHTGQHYDENMSASFFRDLAIPPPDVNLEVGSGSHAAQTARVMETFEPALLSARPDWVVVVGDVNSTMAATLVAVKLGIKVAHVEAGLRSFDRTMPEEINRLVTDALADLLLIHSPEAGMNLAREGVAPEKVVMVGNIMIDSLVASLDQIKASAVGKRLGVAPREYVYVTLHRPANVDGAASLAAIMDALARLSERLAVVFPVHPRTRARLAEHGLLAGLAGQAGLHLIEPVGYHESLELAMNARFVLTDSGGLQEETTYLRVPCLTLRPNTERPVTVTVGTNRLTSLDRLAADIDDTLSDRHPRQDARVPELWDGKTAERIVEVLMERSSRRGAENAEKK
jgi:UDP-N-acetylglucosamine 2-epimerase (non-hydrolysing)